MPRASLRASIWPMTIAFKARFSRPSTPGPQCRLAALSLPRPGLNQASARRIRALINTCPELVAKIAREDDADPLSSRRRYRRAHLQVYHNRAGWHPLGLMNTGMAPASPQGLKAPPDSRRSPILPCFASGDRRLPRRNRPRAALGEGHRPLGVLVNDPALGDRLHSAPRRNPDFLAGASAPRISGAGFRHGSRATAIRGARPTRTTFDDIAAASLIVVGRQKARLPPTIPTASRSTTDIIRPKELAALSADHRRWLRARSLPGMISAMLAISKNQILDKSPASSDAAE